MILFYVQHLLGSGHVHRIRCIAAELVCRGIPVAVVSGGRPLPAARGDDIEWVQLEPLASSGLDFSTLVDTAGRSADAALWQRRARQLSDAWRRYRPRVLCIESYPFARRQFRFELDPLIETARGDRRVRAVVCSIRDILQRRSAERERETVEKVDAGFDAVLVHGDPEVAALDASFGRAADIGGKVVYTGYVAPSPVPRPSAAGGSEVVVAAGGGAAGLRLYETALDAAVNGRLDCRWRLLIGPAVGETDFDRLAARSGPGVRVERNRDDFREVIAAASVLVAQAGYNTLADILVTGVPALLVPFEGAGETEQLQRARCFESLGRVHVLRERELAAARLLDRLETIREAEDPDLPRIDLDGVAFSADWLAACA